MSGVVLDPGAKAHLTEHLQVKAGPLAEPLSLHQLFRPFELGQALFQLLLDADHGPLQPVLGRDVMAAGVDIHRGDLPKDPPTKGVDLRDGLDLIPKEFQPDGLFFFMSGQDLHHVPPHPEGAPTKVNVVSLILDLPRAA